MSEAQSDVDVEEQELEGEDAGEGGLVRHNPIGEYYGGRNDKNERHGRGRAVLPNGDLFLGCYFRGKRHGLGVYRYKNGNGARYGGDWVNGRKHGWGTMYYPDGSQYTGNWYKGTIHGWGVYVYPNGDEYEGWFFYGTKNGRGIYRTKATNEKFVGSWLLGLKHGQGMLIRPEYRYIGNWYNDVPRGPGVYVFPDLGTEQHGRFTIVKLQQPESITKYKDLGYQILSMSTATPPEMSPVDVELMTRMALQMTDMYDMRGEGDEGMPPETPSMPNTYSKATTKSQLASVAPSVPNTYSKATTKSQLASVAPSMPITDSKATKSQLASGAPSMPITDSKATKSQLASGAPSMPITDSKATKSQLASGAPSMPITDSKATKNQLASGAPSLPITDSKATKSQLASGAPSMPITDSKATKSQLASGAPSMPITDSDATKSKLGVPSGNPSMPNNKCKEKQDEEDGPSANALDAIDLKVVEKLKLYITEEQEKHSNNQTQVALVWRAMQITRLHTAYPDETVPPPPIPETPVPEIEICGEDDLDESALKRSTLEENEAIRQAKLEAKTHALGEIYTGSGVCQLPLAKIRWPDDFIPPRTFSKITVSTIEEFKNVVESIAPQLEPLDIQAIIAENLNVFRGHGINVSEKWKECLENETECEDVELKGPPQVQNGEASQMLRGSRDSKLSEGGGGEADFEFDNEWPDEPVEEEEEENDGVEEGNEDQEEEEEYDDDY